MAAAQQAAHAPHSRDCLANAQAPPWDPILLPAVQVSFKQVQFTPLCICTLVRIVPFHLAPQKMCMLIFV